MKREEVLSVAKPILFNTDMVRAILDGRKTETRRAVKLKYSNTHHEMFTNMFLRMSVYILAVKDSEKHSRHTKRCFLLKKKPKKHWKGWGEDE